MSSPIGLLRVLLQTELDDFKSLLPINKNKRLQVAYTRACKNTVVYR